MQETTSNASVDYAIQTSQGLEVVTVEKARETNIEALKEISQKVQNLGKEN